MRVPAFARVFGERTRSVSRSYDRAGVDRETRNGGFRGGLTGLDVPEAETPNGSNQRLSSRTDKPSRCRGMRPADLRDFCLEFPGSVETSPFGPETSVFKVAGKMFALSRLGQSPLQVSLKCEPQLAEQLRKAHRAVIPGYHLNKSHWNTVIIDGSIPERMIKDMVEDSYDLVVSQLPASRRRALGWRRDE
jgi:predicted DNA-binding protein (MmcQ/YjbR family)